MTLLKTKPTNYFTAEETLSNDYIDFPLGIARRVVLYDSNGNPVSAGGREADTASLSNVSDSASSVTLLSANTNRKGFIVFNESTAFLYLKFGATASLTSYTYRINSYQTLEMLDTLIYRGRIDGIWDSAAGGAARITEL